ncbi:hypothetical protein [Natrinema pallidum]|uniref:Uncharacterized protein n=1 Tax=Natrinema pallidum TaxID=69527 RepID=A0A4P9TM18_9EURY|nr:hypothetical protein [Natrinema pallidum]QCW05252.1 hypothetical protein FGF80_18565 [Natrinema pallidum]
MVAKPPLPDGDELPREINGWHHRPESNKNGHAWYAADGETAVAVYSGFGRVYVSVTDERCDGLERGVRIYEDGYEDDIDGRERDRHEARAVVDGIDAACEWMGETAPAEWSNPAVCEAVFDAPPGYSLERYYLENREATVYYRRDGTESITRFPGHADPDQYTLETCPYLYVHEWRGSGNATVALAPWLRAHGSSSKHPEIREVAETPAECGLEVAVTVAREWAREHVGGEIDADAAGQAGLGRWSA